MTAALSMVPSVVVSAFAQPFLEGRRVIVFGSATGCLWDKLLERGARFVHVCDPDPERLAEAAAKNTSQWVSFAPLSNQAALTIRDGAFDVGIIENLAVLSDPSGLVRRMKRALVPRGVAFVCVPNPDVDEQLMAPTGTAKQMLDYYTLYDVVRSEFDVVHMLGQIPFVGYTVAELAPLEEPDPQLDAGFVAGGTEEPEWFIAAASNQPFEVEGFTVVQLPMSDVLQENAVRHLREQLRVSRQAERSAVERLARLEVQLSQVTAQRVDRRATEELTRQLEELKEDLRRKEKWIASVEARASAADLRADEADQQVEQLQQKATIAAEAEARIAQLRDELAEASARVVLTEQQAADTDSDVTRLEAQLKERGERVRQLEAELQAVTRVGEQLVRERQQLQSARGGFQSQAWGADLEVAPAPELSTATAQSTERVSNWGNAGTRIEPTPALHGSSSGKMDTSRQAAGSVGGQVEAPREATGSVGGQVEAPREAMGSVGGQVEAPRETAGLVGLQVEAPREATGSVGVQVDAPGDVKRLLDARARLLADIQAAVWRVEQLRQQLSESAEGTAHAAKLQGLLAQAEHSLREHETLLSQLRSQLPAS